MDKTDELALHYRCEYCLAGPDVWCRTLSGAKATGLHGCRVDSLNAAFAYGYDQGLKAASRMSYSTFPINQTATG